MKKILLWMMLSVLIFTGCQGGNPDSAENPVGSGGGSKTPTSKTSGTDETSQSPQEADHALPDYVCSGTYYKLEIVPVIYDVDAVMDYLLPGVDRSRAQLNGRGEYAIENNNVPYTWGSFTLDTGFQSFSYSRDDVDLSRVMTEQEARGCSDAFIRHMGYQVAENSEFSEYGGSCSVSYYFEYEGVPILEKGSYTMPNGEPVHGEYIDVLMDARGILSVGLVRLYDVTAVLEEYPAEELISRSQLEEVINLAMTASAQFSHDFDPSHEYDFRVKKIELIYIPAQEKEKWVLIPAFRATIADLVDGEEVIYEEIGTGIDHIMLSDALSGYVHLR